MGFAIAWVAVSGKQPERVLEELELTRTGATEDFPEAKLSCAALPGSWFLVFAHDYDSPIVSARSLVNLSAGCQVIACQVEEHVMAAAAFAYADGALLWRVEHEAEQGIYHLSASGSPPPQLDEIHASLKKQQDEEGGADAEVDFIFDVPVALAESIVGYRHDRDTAASFEVLRQEGAAPSGRAWWKIW